MIVQRNKYILVKYRKKLKDCQSKSSKWAFEDTEFSNGRDVSEWPYFCNIVLICKLNDQHYNGF